MMTETYYEGKVYHVIREGRRYFVVHRETGRRYGDMMGGWRSLRQVEDAARQWDRDEVRRRADP